MGMDATLFPEHETERLAAETMRRIDAAEAKAQRAEAARIARAEIERLAAVHAAIWIEEDELTIRQRHAGRHRDRAHELEHAAAQVRAWRNAITRRVQMGGPLPSRKEERETLESLYQPWKR